MPSKLMLFPGKEIDSSKTSGGKDELMALREFVTMCSCSVKLEKIFNCDWADMVNYS